MCGASSVYAEKMAGWTKAIKAAFPSAQVALIGCRWNSYRKEREDDWNKQVLQNPVSAEADAATFHIYCPFDETNNSSEPANLNKHLAQAFFRRSVSVCTPQANLRRHYYCWMRLPNRVQHLKSVSHRT